MTRARIDQLLAKIEDAYFDYDKFSLRPDALKALQVDSAELRDILKDYPDYKVTIEGHDDERGSALAIGVRVPPGTIWSRSGSRRLNSRSSATEKNVRSARSTARPAGSGIAASTSLPRRKHRNDFLGHPDWHTRRIV